MVELKTPCTNEDIEKLKCGDVVKMSGVLYTGRDQAHKRMVAALKEGGELPFDIEGQAIYYVGPTPNKPGEVIGSAGPTTSYRMDDLTVPLLEKGLKIMIGKGKRNVRRGKQPWDRASRIGRKNNSTCCKYRDFPNSYSRSSSCCEYKLPCFKT